MKASSITWSDSGWHPAVVTNSSKQWWNFYVTSWKLKTSFLVDALPWGSGIFGLMSAAPSSNVFAHQTAQSKLLNYREVLTISRYWFAWPLHSYDRSVQTANGCTKVTWAANTSVFVTLSFSLLWNISFVANLDYTWIAATYNYSFWCLYN